GDLGAVGGGDDVAGLEPGLGRRAVVHHLLDLRPAALARLGLAADAHVDRRRGPAGADLLGVHDGDEQPLGLARVVEPDAAGGDGRQSGLGLLAGELLPALAAVGRLEQPAAGAVADRRAVLVGRRPGA